LIDPGDLSDTYGSGWHEELKEVFMSQKKIAANWLVVGNFFVHSHLVDMLE